MLTCRKEDFAVFKEKIPSRALNFLEVDYHQLAMGISVPILSANFPHAMAADCMKHFQIYVLERP